eukprot:9273238-Karenia_brevis.AAC.1
MKEAGLSNKYIAWRKCVACEKESHYHHRHHHLNYRNAFITARGERIQYCAVRSVAVLYSTTFAKSMQRNDDDD